MSPKVRVALTFLLVVLAVAIWGLSQLPAGYDRSVLGDGERLFAACLFMLAIALNLPGLAKRRRQRHAATPDYYVHFDDGQHHPPAAPVGRPSHHAHPSQHAHQDARAPQAHYDRRH